MKGQCIHFLLNSDGMEAVVFWDFVNHRLSIAGLGGFVAAQLGGFDVSHHYYPFLT